MNLYETYRDILSNENLWNCFSKAKFEYEIDTIFDKHNSSNFIKEYLFFNLGSKTLPWHDLKINANDFEIKAHHTVSLFFLGISMFESLSVEFKNIPIYDGDPYKNFVYFWSKICLYHDIGYIYETQSKTNSVLRNEVNTIDKLVKKLNIQNNVLDILENKDIVNKYYTYRIEERKAIDHGIVGGMILYDKTLKYIDEQKKIHDSCLIYCGDTRKFDEFSCERMKFIAESIIKHNMWFANEQTMEIYEKHEMDELRPLEDNSHRYSFDNNPIFFLLCLIDSIEPIKKIEKYSKKTILDLLKSFNFKCSDMTICITIVDANLLELYFNAIKSLESWLRVKIIKKSVDEIQIEII